MSGDSDSRNLTLQDLWEREAETSDQEGSSGHEFTMNWARTLLAQITVIGSLLGIRLPRPVVSEGPTIVWELPKAHLRIKPEKRTPSGTPDGSSDSPADHDDFLVSGSIYSPPTASRGDQKEFLSFTVRGKSSREFLFASAVNWFPLENSFPLPPSRTVRPQPEGETIVETTVGGRKAIWIRPDEPGDIHELVRWNLTRLRKEGVAVDGVRMKPRQMAVLSQGWDGVDAPPPEPEAVELARSIDMNLHAAALSLGKEFGPSTYVFLDDSGSSSDRNVVVQVCVDTGTTFLEVDIKCETDHNRVSFLLDYDPTDASPKKWYLRGDCRIARESGKSAFQILREVIQPEKQKLSVSS